MIFRINRLDIAAIDWGAFISSDVDWLGAGPFWCGRYLDAQGLKVSFRSKITPKIYIKLKRHHDNAGDRRLKATEPPSPEWFMDGIRKGMFWRMPVMPSAVIYAASKSTVRKRDKRPGQRMQRLAA